MAGTTIVGIPASPGVAVGPAYVHKNIDISIPEAIIEAAEVAAEVERFRKGRDRTRTELEKILLKASEALSEEEAEVFEGHIEILMDEDLEEEILVRIQDELLPALKAVALVIDENVAEMEGLEDEYMAARAADIRDIGRRLLFAVAEKELSNLDAIDVPSIIVAHDLTPSETAVMDRKNVLAFVTEVGGRSSHVAIMAKSLEIPAIVGAGSLVARINTGDILAVDALDGKLIVEPDADQHHDFQGRIAAWHAEQKELAELRDLPAETTDGHRVEMVANIGTPADVDGALRHGAEGIGLFRTEFLFMDRDRLPTEDEQFKAYKSVVQAMHPHPVIIRTMDIGGDKELSYLEVPKEENPFLGWRAIRMCLDRPDMFRVQLRAILRASRFGKIRVMFPMIDSLEEVRRAKDLVEEAAQELRERGEKFDDGIEIGLMIETPAAAVTARKLAQEVDFFSIGTNDLTQYTLAVDRGNTMIAPLYQPLHPAVLSLIKTVIDASHEAGKWTGMCGELASDEAAALVLVGMGLDELSMSAVNIGKVKKYLRAHSLVDLKAIADDVLEQGAVGDILKIVDRLR